MAFDPKTIPYVVNRFGSTTLLDDVLADDDTIQVVDASRLPEGDLGGCIQIDQEIIIFESRNLNTLLGCRRGLDGSEATSHRRGDIVTSKIVALSFNNMKDALLGLDNKISTLKQSEVITINQEMVLLKSFALNAAPSDPRTIEIVPAGGLTQIYGVDYNLVGSSIVWGGLGLDGVLEVGDEIVVVYDKS